MPSIPDDQQAPSATTESSPDAAVSASSSASLLATAASSMFDIVAEAIAMLRLLRHSGVPATQSLAAALTDEFTPWLFEYSPLAATTIFTCVDAQGRCAQQDFEVILARLEKYDTTVRSLSLPTQICLSGTEGYSRSRALHLQKKTAIIFMEHLVYDHKFESEVLHTRLAVTYLYAIDPTSSQSSSSSESTRQAGSKASRRNLTAAMNVVAKLEVFVLVHHRPSSTGYSPEMYIDRLNKSSAVCCVPQIATTSRRCWP